MVVRNELLQERIRDLYVQGETEISNQMRHNLAAEFECSMQAIGNAIWNVNNPSGHKKYYRTHQVAAQNGRMVKLGRGGERVSNQEWCDILDRYNHQCAICGSVENIQMDHIHPISQGGVHTASNIQPLCNKCNRKKGDNIFSGSVTRSTSMTTYTVGQTVQPSGWGRTSTWPKISGTVTNVEVPLHKGHKTRVFVHWNGTSFEDEMEPQELVEVNPK